MQLVFFPAFCRVFFAIFVQRFFISLKFVSNRETLGSLISGFFYNFFKIFFIFSIIFLVYPK